MNTIHNVPVKISSKYLVGSDLTCSFNLPRDIYLKILDDFGLKVAKFIPHTLLMLGNFKLQNNGDPIEVPNIGDEFLASLVKLKNNCFVVIPTEKINIDNTLNEIIE